METIKLSLNADCVFHITPGAWPYATESVEEVKVHGFLERLPHHDPDVPRLAEIVSRMLNPNHPSYKDGTIEYLEDLSKRPPNALITFFNEAHRVLIPGGKMILQVPTIGANSAFSHPDNKRYFSWDFLKYFSRPRRCVPKTAEWEAAGQPEWDWKTFGTSNGISARFDIVSLEVDNKPDRRFLDAVLSKSKD